MGKPRQRTPHVEIIDRPELKSPLRNAVEGTVTVALWATWAYWFFPVLLTILLWGFGIKLFYFSLFDPYHIKELHLILRIGGASVLSIFFVNLIWINYNYQMIHKKFGRRRQRSCLVVDRRIADIFGIDADELAAIKRHNRFEIALAGKKAVIKSATSMPSSR
jgi:poly-beta-1,6-N-acetyl-D-glucosamine biosynthesis protein PgaD